MGLQGAVVGSRKGTACEKFGALSRRFTWVKSYNEGGLHVIIMANASYPLGATVMDSGMCFQLAKGI